MGRKIVIVTGATGAIGKAIALRIAASPTHEVVLVCRDSGKGERAVAEIREATGNSSIGYELAELSSRADIENLAKRWRGPLHVLVNNAAEAPKRREVTSEGLERQFATNIMGQVWMMQEFLDLLKATPAARVVNVASYWAGDLDIDDLQFQRRSYDNDTAYRQSKQANRMLTVAFAERWKRHSIAVNVCHPGDVSSQLSNDLGFGGHETPDQGARTPVWLAMDDVGIRKTGKYFAQMREEPCRFGRDRAAVEALYEACVE